MRVFRGGRHIVPAAGARAADFLAREHDLDDEGVQQVLARLTGNYRRGNER